MCNDIERMINKFEDSDEKGDDIKNKKLIERFNICKSNFEKGQNKV